MAEFSQFGSKPTPKSFGFKIAKKSSTGVVHVDYRDTDTLQRLLTPNGKIQSRKRTGLSSREQRIVAMAIKRARYMALLPYTSATL